MAESELLINAGVSDREAEVLALVGDHLTNAEIAGRLFISVRTVESHVSSLLRKLGLTDRRGLADLAVSIGVADRAAGGPDREPVVALAADVRSWVGRRNGPPSPTN